MEILDDWRQDRAVRATFDNAGHYASYLENPTAEETMELEGWRSYLSGERRDPKRERLSTASGARSVRSFPQCVEKGSIT